MCGISGWVGPPDPEKLTQMVASLSHRGPDETGLWVGAEASLGIARLSIIDVAAGHQPVASDDGSIVAVCNGEIYNFRQLAAELRSQGVILKSGSDVEVIPHLYQRHGLDFVKRLRGMFSIALWDAQVPRLVLARDRVGKKPLVYAHDRQRLLFASEARALVAAGWCAEVDLQALDHVLAFATVPPGRGAWQGLRSLPPGHLGVWEGDRLRLARYWSWSPGNHLPKTGIGEQVHATLEEAVQTRLVSERPIGAFLSGGIDSTIITAIMARHHSDPVKTFCIGFDDTALDESRYARQVADFLGTDHSEVILTPDPVTILESLAKAYDQPFADSSAIPSLLLSELASRDVVVALSGDGGDEAFGGYLRYQAAPVLQRLNPGLSLTSRFARPLGEIADRAGQRRLGRLARHMTPARNLGIRYRELMEYQPTGVRHMVWSSEALRQVCPSKTDEIFQATWESHHSYLDLDHMRAVDMSTYLPNDLLVKVDIASMAHSLEVRSPFLDQEVLALAARIPGDLLIKRRTTKWILRQLAYKLVPREIVDRPKAGFAVPQAGWLRGPLREAAHDLLLDRTARQRGWFNQGVVKGFLDEHDAGINRDRYLWPMLMVENWARHWIDGR